MGDLNGFNAEDVEPNTAYDAVPPGWYTAIITESEWKETRAGTGRYLALTIEIAEGTYANRKIWANLNLDNPNEKAVEIAQRDLSAICRAVGVLRPKNSEELHFKKLEIKVATQKDNADRNEVKGYRAVGSGDAKSASKSGGSKSESKPETKTSTPPWKRSA